jgi:hypothetical protein
MCVQVRLVLWMNRWMLSIYYYMREFTWQRAHTGDGKREDPTRQNSVELKILFVANTQTPACRPRNNEIRHYYRYY